MVFRIQNEAMREQPSLSPDIVPVLIGVGEVADRNERPLAKALDPVGLMAAALARAEQDAGSPGLLQKIDRLDIINEISWPYPDPEAEIRERLGRLDLFTRYWPVGGQTPLAALHEAALDIQAGRCGMVAVCGGEAEASVRKATKQGETLPWPSRDREFKPIRGGDFQGIAARELELTTPVHVYPLYENAARATWDQSLADAQAESAAIWANNSRIAAERDTSWLGREVEPHAILSGEQGNRMLAWPYRKLMVANPVVNQGAAFVVTSLAKARALSLDENRLIYIHGGAAADEPRDMLARTSYDRSRAMEAVLQVAQGMSGSGFGARELYSCFPCVPKMARRILDLPVGARLTEAGGLTFFGAPLNNYMSHAVVAMVHTLRRSGASGLLYGQGEYVTKHHAVVLSGDPPAREMDPNFRLTDVENALVGDAPRLDQSARGPARLETFTILFDRGENVRHGIAICRDTDESRIAARVPQDDALTLARLQAEQSPIGLWGRLDGSGPGVAPNWTLAS